MKNRKKLLIVALLFLLFPIIVLADMDSPEITSYEVRVTSINGINLVDWDGQIITTIAYDTILKITMEEHRDGILYGATETNKNWGYVKLLDTTLVKKKLI